jgi:hypothetical protein
MASMNASPSVGSYCHGYSLVNRSIRRTSRNLAEMVAALGKRAELLPPPALQHRVERGCRWIEMDDVVRQDKTR